MTTIKQFLADNEQLVHSRMKKVTSHVQRQVDNWIQNTILIENCDVPFKYKRQKKYKSLQGAMVDIIYYPTTEQVAGMTFDYMKVVKINVS